MKRTVLLIIVVVSVFFASVMVAPPPLANPGINIPSMLRKTPLGFMECIHGIVKKKSNTAIVCQETFVFLLLPHVKLFNISGVMIKFLVFSETFTRKNNVLFFLSVEWI